MVSFPVVSENGHPHEKGECEFWACNSQRWQVMAYLGSVWDYVIHFGGFAHLVHGTSVSEAYIILPLLPVGPGLFPCSLKERLI